MVGENRNNQLNQQVISAYNDYPEEQKTEEQIQEENIKEKKRFFKILATLILVTGVVVLAIIWYQKPDFPIGWIIAIGAIVITIFLSLFFGFDLYRKMQEDKKEKEAENKKDVLPPHQ